MPKSVCIIGAGPSGLVAAKTLATEHLHLQGSSPLFNVTLYEARPSVGGLWPCRRNDYSTFIHPLMTANLSRHTVQFSDLAWEEGLPEFPRAWQVGQYLERYAEKYLRDCSNVQLNLGRKVVRARRPGGAPEGWVVESENMGGGDGDGRETREFDYLVVASGFFGKERMPPWLLDRPGGDAVPVVHSSSYRAIESLLGEKKDSQGGKILVVGGQLSGIEIAGSIATELSSAANSPGLSAIPHAGKMTVHHLAERSAWVFPLYTTPTPTRKAPYFLPSDFGSCNLATRTQPLTNARGGLISEDAAREAHDRIKASQGSDQSEFHPLAVPDPSSPPYASKSDVYLPFLRSGLITLSKGHLTGLQGGTAQTTSGPIEDIAAVVLATGFSPSESLSFLPDDVLGALCHDPAYPDLTPALAFHGTHHPSAPGLGFVGFYRGPWWGVMEMQARFLAKLWDSSPHSASLSEALASDRSAEQMLAMRGSPRTAQFPMGDYLFLMDSFARALGMGLSPPLTPKLHVAGSLASSPLDIITPARYIYPTAPDASRSETEKSLTQTHESTKSCLTSTRFLAAAVFRNLLGEWLLDRELDSKLPSHPSGRFRGRARFLVRKRTGDGLQCASDTVPPAAKSDDCDDGSLEYLYIEEGNFTASNGFSFPATRRYVYRYSEETDTLSVWFVKVEDNLRADYLFHEVEFLPQDTGGGRMGGLRAKAGHLCIEDFYSVDYEFAFKGVGMGTWSVGYDVRGPKKEYTLRGVYTRP